MYSRSAPRRRHGAELKAKVLADCDKPGASISAVALAHGLNTNLVRQWRAGRGVRPAGTTVILSAVRKAPGPIDAQASPPLSATAEFVALAMPAQLKATSGASTKLTASAPGQAPSSQLTTEPDIHVDLRRGPVHL